MARSIAKIFRVNDDLVESISLAHDLGHSPFGHAGEDELNYKMKKNGGFNHNFHALKILTKLSKFQFLLLIDLKLLVFFTLALSFFEPK